MSELDYSRPLECDVAIVGAEMSAMVAGGGLKMGQAVRFIYTGPGPGVFAWDSPRELDPRQVDVPRYRELFLRAMSEVVQPLGVTEALLKEWLFHRERPITMEDVRGLAAGQTRMEMPLFGELPRLPAEV
jgi:hypothetical protein